MGDIYENNRSSVVYVLAYRHNGFSSRLNTIVYIVKLVLNYCYLMTIMFNFYK